MLGIFSFLVCERVHACSQRSASGAFPREPSALFFESGSLTEAASEPQGFSWVMCGFWDPAQVHLTPGATFPSLGNFV